MHTFYNLNTTFFSPWTRSKCGFKASLAETVWPENILSRKIWYKGIQTSI